MTDFSSRIIAWQKTSGRHGLPWQVQDPYAIWLSEIMLQQTQVDTVLPYYRRFLARFPDVASLAAAAEDEVLALWSGLGYYARARNLHKAAQKIVNEHGAVFPRQFELILALPGVGRSTAAAISAFAFAERRAILDGNVKRVLCRMFGVEGWPGDKTVENRLWDLAEVLLPEAELATYSQGLMDLGATLCRRSRPECACCPCMDSCVANREGRQASLPVARPRKALPEKSVRMLILLHGGSVLLQKRPVPGIWGGLWSLPEAPVYMEVDSAVRQLGYVPQEVATLEVLMHSFSHFRLRIQPSVMHIPKLPIMAETPGNVWLPLVDILDAALPTPVRFLLRQVLNGVGG